MSDIPCEKYLYAIIRKPQEGKTYICLENINMNPKFYHIIITMNTIKSNLQFFDRAKRKFGSNICVFNSKETKKDQTPDFLHAKDVIGVKKYLRAGSNVVIMCGHPIRFDCSIIELLNEIEDSSSMKKQVIIHIDEAHAYVPTYRDKVVEMNNMSVTERIYMYSATPFNIWTNIHSVINKDQLFKNIFVVDVEAEFKIKISNPKKYFGIKSCQYVVGPATYPIIDEIIPNNFIKRWGNQKQITNVNNGETEDWYSTSWPFDIGDEIKMLSFTRHTLQILNGKEINNDKFSFNFIPGFVRKLTHYYIMENVLKIYSKAIVIIINGDGTQLFLMNDSVLTGESIPSLNEPSDQIEYCIKKYPERPVFITGFHCVGMSVTFINESIGNFDNVIFSHEHYLERPDVHYQLCRFLFNYNSWKSVENIKKTKLHVSNYNIIQNCLDYENQIDIICSDMTGSLRTKEEVVGQVKIKEKKIPKERKYDSLEPYCECNLKTISVDEEDEADEKFEKVKAYYKNFMGKELSGKALPKKGEDLKDTEPKYAKFYHCSTTGNVQVFFNTFEMKKRINSWKNTSNFQLSEKTTKYARVYVVYDDSSEYKWFIRTMEIKKCPEVVNAWKSINEKKYS